MNIGILEDLPHHVQTFQHLLLLSDVLPALLFSHETTEPPIHSCLLCPSSDHGAHFGKKGNSNSFYKNLYNISHVGIFRSTVMTYLKKPVGIKSVKRVP